MKIALDLRPLQIGHQNRGIGSYLLNVLAGLPKNQKDISFVCIRYADSNPIKEYNLLPDQNYEEILMKNRDFASNPVAILKYAWHNLTPRYIKLHRYHPDVFFQSDYLLGAPRIRGCRIIVVSYDLIPFVLGSLYLPRWQKFAFDKQLRLRSRLRRSVRAAFYRKKYKNGVKLLQRADKILSISKTTSNDLVKLTGIDKSSITTIPLAPSFRDQKTKVPRQEIRNVIENISGHYACFIGGTDKRRQVHELIHAHNLMNAKGEDFSLVLVGNEFDLSQKELDPIAKKAINSSSYIKKIHLVGKVSEADKFYILQNATAFVYPSLYEGFGLPILEAMQAMCPVITYDNSSIREVAGSSVIYANPENGLGISKALQDLISSRILTKNMQRRGKERVAHFSWDKTIKQTWRQVIKLSE